MLNIAVIGCGAVGMTTALAIQKKYKDKVKVTIFSEEFSPKTTSDVSAGLWMPYLVEDTPSELLTRWSKCTQDFLMKLWKEGKAEEYGINLVPMYVFNEQEDVELPEWTEVTLGLHVFNREELDKVNKKYKSNVKHAYSFMTFTWEPSVFLPAFQQKFVENNGVIIHKKIQSFDELNDFDLIVNCAGLNAKYLTNDNTVFPIRGQVMRVEAPWQYHILMMDIGEGNYVIPNKNCIILGGTHQENDYSCEVNDPDRLHILNGCSAFVPALKTSKVIAESAGLRPARREVRLDVEHRLRPDGKSQYIIHNYGHGGCGVTLSVGCAEDAVELIGNTMNLLRNKL